MTEILFSKLKNKIHTQHIITIDNIENEDNIKFYKKVLQKLKNSESNYNSRNTKKINDCNNFFCSFVFYYPIDNHDVYNDVFNNVKYNKNFEYVLDLKIQNLNFTDSKKIVEHICDKSNYEDRNSYFLKDIHMETKLKDIKFKKNQKFNIYYLKIKCNEELTKLLKNKYKLYDESIDEICKKYYDKINIVNNDIDNIINNIFYILNFYKKINNNIWIKSQGEFYCIMSLILFLNSAIQINKKDIDNPNSNRKLEIDFYISNMSMAIEVDGKHHKNNNDTIKNDIIKNIILENNNVKLIRFEWNNNKINEFCENIYDELNNYHNHKYNKSLNISKEKYLELITKIQENIIFPTFDYTYQHNIKLPENFVNNIDSDIKNKHHTNMFIDNTTNNDYKLYNEKIEQKIKK